MATNNFSILEWEDSVRVDETIEKYEYVRYPFNAGGIVVLNSVGDIRFNIESGDIFTHPHGSFLEFEGELTKAAGGVRYVDNALIALVNNAMMHLFSQIRYEIAGREIETILNPGQTTTMLGLLEYSADFSMSKGLNQCWFKDSDNKYDDVNQARAANTNRGFIARRDLLLNNVEEADKKGNFNFIVPLSHIFGFCKDYDKVLYGVRQTLILKRKIDMEPYFKDNGADAGTLTLRNIYWHMPHVTPSIENLNNLMKSMEKNVEVKMGFNKRESFSIQLPEGNTRYTWALTTKETGEKPRFLVVGFQNTEQARNQQKNAGAFRNLNLLEIYVRLNNSRRYPESDFNFNFTENRYANAYNSLSNYKALVDGVPACVSNCNINPIDFKYLYPLFVIDISKQTSALKSSIINVTVEMKFGTNIPANTIAYATLLTDKVFTLKADGRELKPIY